MRGTLRSRINCRSLVGSIAFLALLSAGIGKTRRNAAVPNPGDGPAVLWRDPAGIRSRDLFHGAGGAAHQPRGPFTFEKENSNGSSPKFEVVGQDGAHWTVKMGEEARPETAASRLVWATGYFATEDYFLPVLHVENMPRLHRGGGLVSPDGTVHNVRLKRHPQDQKKIGSWSWQNDPFVRTREWYGLQVLMAVINNWDLKDSNNSIYQLEGPSPEQRYVITDLGASFGAAGFNDMAKGKLRDYQRSKWIGKTSAGSINFNVPAAPSAPIVFNLPEFSLRRGLLWLGRKVPVADARWMGSLLARLSPGQIRDAFRAAGYSPDEIDGYSQVLEERIARLNGL